VPNTSIALAYNRKPRILGRRGGQAYISYYNKRHDALINYVIIASHETLTRSDNSCQ